MSIYTVDHTKAKMNQTEDGWRVTFTINTHSGQSFKESNEDFSGKTRTIELVIDGAEKGKPKPTEYASEPFWRLPGEAEVNVHIIRDKAEVQVINFKYGAGTSVNASE